MHDEEMLKELENMSDEDIDFSDIPEITEEELKNFVPSKIRRKEFFELLERSLKEKELVAKEGH